jgi:hypothetical protein
VCQAAQSALAARSALLLKAPPATGAGPHSSGRSGTAASIPPLLLLVLPLLPLLPLLAFVGVEDVD